MSDVNWIPRIGDQFAGDRLVSLLGHGGISIVYRAEHIGLERTVALKLLSPQLSNDEDFRERFQRESKVAASLEHPNIIPIYEAGGENGVFYIAMRYVDGADLKTRLKESGQLEAQQVVSFVAQVAAALEAAHARGLIHRDVKPANILIAPVPGSKVGSRLSLRFRGRQEHGGGGADQDGIVRRHCRVRLSPSRSRVRSSTAGPTSTRSATSRTRRSPGRRHEKSRRSR